MLKELFSLQDKTCVVTGGSRGLGFAIARIFLDAGARRVYITARKEAACQQAAEELSQFGECIAIPSDLAQMEEVERFSNLLKEQESSIDVLVNNAGVGWLAPLEEFPEKGWDKVMDLNVKSPFFLTQKLLPLLREGGSQKNTASVINIGSIAGILGKTDTFSYAPSKSAIHQVTRNLAYTLADQHIRVNAIAPGRFHTSMTDYAKADEAAYQNELRSIPLHRWGEDTDIMGVALMLASAAGAFITGQIIPVDGGTTVA
ncbi:MAG: SDR family oxidoreductase [Oceanicoccus sp.]